MATLKSALRFPSRAPAPAPTAELPSIPFNLATPPPARRQLTSRFSAETLVVKSPPLLQRMRAFTQDPSPPSSPLRSTRLGHAVSASDSRIDILDPTSFNAPRRYSDEEVLSPRAISAGSGGERRGVEAAGEVFGTRERGNNREEIRSRDSSTTLDREGRKDGRQRASRSSVSAKGLNPPPRPRRIGTSPPKRPPPPPPQQKSAPSACPSDKPFVPPTRSDSRNASQTYKVPASRPQSPPSTSIAPLNIPPRPNAVVASTAPVASTTPFRALLARPPSTRAVRTNSPGSHLVSVDVGGTIFTTSLETLTRPDRGAGKLGEFIEAVVEEVKGEAEKKDKEATARCSARASSRDFSSDDDEGSILNPSHFAVSPYPSPFAYSHYDEQVSSDPASLDLDLMPASPTSPADPFAQKLFLPLPSFTAPPAPLFNRHQAQLVHSPVPHMRIKSVHPDIVPSPTTPRAPRPSSLDSTSSCPNLRLRAKSNASAFEVNPFERALGPFFEVLPGQQRELDVAAGVDSPTSVERESEGVPRDIGERSAEDQSRSTLLGVPRGSVRKGSRRPRHQEAPALPQPILAAESAGSRPPSLTTSLSTDDGGAEDGAEGPEEGRFEVFLDRDAEPWTAIFVWLRDGVLPPSHSLLTSTASRSFSTPDIDTTALLILSLHPESALTLLAVLRGLEVEANWLGISSLVDACQSERERVADAVRWIEDERRRSAKRNEAEQRAEVMKAREKAVSDTQLPSILYQIPRNPFVVVGLNLALGWASGFVTKSSVNSWFKGQRKPPGNPPPIAFPIAWTILYICMGLASHLIVARYDKAVPGSAVKADANTALKLYWAQFGLNMLWTPLFFGIRKPFLALLDILPLTFTVFKLTALAGKIDPRAQYLLIPYSAWVSLATYLNVGIVHLNGHWPF